MTITRDPKWLNFLSRHCAWLALPNLAYFFTGLQILGVFLVMTDPSGASRMALIPENVLQGEVWRLLSFLAIPLSGSPLWMIFSLLFTFFIVNSIEAEWGEFKTTFYILISLLLMVSFSFFFGYPLTEAKDFYASLFLAATALFPNQEVRLYFFLPVKMKMLGWLALAFLFLRILQGGWMDRLYLLAIYFNYFLFFGPTLISRVRDWKRRRDYRAKLR